MNHLKRAWLSVARRKGKTLILLTVVFILGNIIAGAFSISQASKRVETNIKQKLGADATIRLDWEAVMEAEQKAQKEGIDFSYEFGFMDLATLEKIAQLPQVSEFDYTLYSSFLSNGIKTVQTEGEIMPRGEDDMEYPGYFGAMGISKPDFKDIREGRIEITSGAVFTENDFKEGTQKVLISEKLASSNGLAVGDKVEFYTEVHNYMSETVSEPEKFNYTLEIAGIFKPLSFEETEDKDSDGKKEPNHMENRYDNQLYIPSNFSYKQNLEIATRQFEMNEEAFSNYTPERMVAESMDHTYVLNSPEDIDSFKEDTASYLPEYFGISVSSDSYDSIAGPIKSLDKMSSLTLYVAIGASVLILSLVIVLFLRDRKHELGIYLSLGDTRGKVVSQILIEVLMIAFIGFTLSIFTGNVIAKGLSNSLVNQEKFDDGMMYKKDMYYYDGSINTEELIDAYSIDLSVSYIIGFYGIGLAVVALSTIVPTVYITRLNPKKIMM